MVLLSLDVEKMKGRITSPESAMTTSTAGRSPAPFATFSVEIKDKKGLFLLEDALSLTN